MPRKKILVTGATGLIGRYALEPLRQSGFEVTACSRKSFVGAEAAQADLLDTKAIATLFRRLRPDYLLHFAWDVRPGIYPTSDENYVWVFSGMEMLRRFKEYGGVRAVFAGSCLEYAPSADDVSEDSPIRPDTTYAICKDCLNRMATRFCRDHEISYGWARIFYVYGPNAHPASLTPSIIRALRAGERFTIKNRSLIRDYMHAEDIGTACARFVAGSVEGNVNICTGVPLSLAEYASRIAGALDRTDFLVLDDVPTSQPPRIVGDSTRLTREIGFVPKFTLATGITDVLARENPEAPPMAGR